MNAFLRCQLLTLCIQLLLNVSRLFHVKKNLEACRSDWKESGLNLPSSPKRSNYSFREPKDTTREEKKVVWKGAVPTCQNSEFRIISSSGAGWVFRQAPVDPAVPVLNPADLQSSGGQDGHPRVARAREQVLLVPLPVHHGHGLPDDFALQQNGVPCKRRDRFGLGKKPQRSCKHKQK